MTGEVPLREDRKRKTKEKTKKDTVSWQLPSTPLSFLSASLSLSSVLSVYVRKFWGGVWRRFGGAIVSPTKAVHRQTSKYCTWQVDHCIGVLSVVSLGSYRLSRFGSISGEGERREGGGTTACGSFGTEGIQEWIKRVGVTNKRPAWTATAARQLTSCAVNPQAGVRLVREVSLSVKGSSTSEGS